MTGSPDFQAFLDPGETLLWQGRPTGDLYADRDSPNRGAMRWLTWALFGGLPVFLVFTLGRNLSGSLPGTALLIAVGVMFALAGWYFTTGKPYFDAHRRRKSRYALSDRRILTATPRGNGFRIRAQNIDPKAPIAWDGHDPGDVTQTITHDLGPDTRQVRTVQGFYKIAGAENVYARMRAAQKDLHQGARAK
jgi:hypothetical protein